MTARYQVTMYRSDGYADTYYIIDMTTLKHVEIDGQLFKTTMNSVAIAKARELNG